VWGNCGVSPQYGAVNCSNLNGTKDPVNIERKHTIRSGGKPREITQLGLLEHFHLRYIVDSTVTEPGLGVLWCDLGKSSAMA
jgi:hypothetical protein